MHVFKTFKFLRTENVGSEERSGGGAKGTKHRCVWLRIAQTWSSIVNSEFLGELQVLGDWELRLWCRFPYSFLLSRVNVPGMKTQRSCLVFFIHIHSLLETFTEEMFSLLIQLKGTKWGFFWYTHKTKQIKLLFRKLFNIKMKRKL